MNRDDIQKLSEYLRPLGKEEFATHLEKVRELYSLIIKNEFQETNEDACLIMLRCIEEFEDDFEVVTFSCKSLRFLTRNEENTSRLIKANACQVLLKTFKRFELDFAFIEVWMLPLWNILIFPDESNRRIFVDLGGCEICVAMLERYPDVPSVAEAFIIGKII